MKLFFDTSAFGKRYVAETGSDAVLVLCEEAESIGLSTLCLLELTSTLCRQMRERKLSKAKYGELHTLIVANVADVDICDITPEVMKHTLVQLESAPLSTLTPSNLAVQSPTRPRCSFRPTRANSGLPAARV
jgi:predicted nucleic acid-binding protein